MEFAILHVFLHIFFAESCSCFASSMACQPQGELLQPLKRLKFNLVLQLCERDQIHPSTFDCSRFHPPVH